MNLTDITVTDILSASVIQASKGRRLSMLCRPSYALHFCTSGKITYTHNGKKFIADEGHAIILPMGATYELYNNEGGKFPLINFYTSDNKFTDEFITYPISSAAPYLEDIKKIITLTNTKENRLLKISLLYKIFNRISYESNKAIQILAPAVRYMESHLCKTDITNVLLAKEANISEIYLRTLFKESYNTTPRQYLISLRIEQAKKLLVGTNDTIQNIALATGFSGIYHFTRAFKNSTSMSPTEYRKVFLNYFA